MAIAPERAPSRVRLAARAASRGSGAGGSRARAPARARPWRRGRRGSRAGLSLSGCSAGTDVLVHVEEVVRVVLCLGLRQPLVVAAVGGLNPLLSLLHHEVDVGAAEGVWMKRLPVVDGPGPDRVGPR